MTTKIQHNPTPALVEDGHAHLRDLIQMAALHAQHNMDSTFILQFMDMYMQKGFFNDARHFFLFYSLL
jgi:hypothetical protein